MTANLPNLTSNLEYLAAAELQQIAGAYTMVYTLGWIDKIYATCFAKNYSKSWCLSKVYAYPFMVFSYELQ
jgi:hypothetical protein